MFGGKGAVFLVCWPVSPGRGGALIGSIAIVSGELHVFSPGALDSTTQIIVHRPNYSGRHTHSQRARRDAGPFSHESARRNDGTGLNNGTAKDDGAHTDETLVFYDAAVKEAAMADAYTGADQGG